MSTRLRRASMFTLLGLSALSAQQPPNQPDVLDQITASVMNGASAEILRELTDDIGARLVGSPAYNQAAQWAVARFREAGVASVVSLRMGGAVVAATTYALSDHPTRIAQHIDQDSVREILRRARLDVDLVNTLWRP